MNESSKSPPVCLTETERQNPHIVLEDFFSCFHLQDIHEMLWDWLVAALSSESGAYGSGHARSNLIYVYEKIMLLMQAANAINRRNKKKQRRHHVKRARKFSH